MRWVALSNMALARDRALHVLVCCILLVVAIMLLAACSASETSSESNPPPFDIESPEDLGEEPAGSAAPDDPPGSNGDDVAEAEPPEGEPLPHPPPMAGGNGASDPERLTRFPTLDAPDTAVAGVAVDVVVALTRDQLTPEVAVEAGPGSAVTETGALELALPDDTDSWRIDVDLLAAGFDIAEGERWIRSITLHRSGDSDFARFSIVARPIAGEQRTARLIARFNHEGRFLGSAARDITILRDAATAGAPPPAAVTEEPLPADAPLVLGQQVEVPDLSVVIHYDDPVALGRGVAYFHSPHLGAPVSEAIDTSADLPRWLEGEYARLVDLGLRLRGATPLHGAPRQPVNRQFVAAVAGGLGDALYDNHVPRRFREAYWLLHAAGRLSSIQITSNSAVFPWELVRPSNPESGAREDFLGIAHRVARWAPRESGSQLDVPRGSFAFTTLATLAPAYEGGAFLPFQQREIDALSRLRGHRSVGGDFGSLLALLEEDAPGFVHFSGHGEVNDPGSANPVFGIRLADEVLDPATWRALNAASSRRGERFYFFNACDTGRSGSLGGFVQGWGPAMLNAGAAGFIGGMWPLSDSAAADFSIDFYERLGDGFAGGSVHLADVLRQVRGRFHETGDPTFLAYTFYGDANLQVTDR